LGRERYVPTQARFGKGREATFEDFMTAKIVKIALFGTKPSRTERSCQTLRKGPAFQRGNREKSGRNRKEQS
jgi:hypothetical protein